MSSATATEESSVLTATTISSGGLIAPERLIKLLEGSTLTSLKETNVPTSQSELGEKAFEQKPPSVLTEETIGLEPPTRLERPLSLQREIRLEVTSEARSYLAGDLRYINEHVEALCIEYANRMRISIEGMRLLVKHGWEEDFTELVLQVFVHANIPQSLALWDSVGDAIERWATHQSVLCQTLLYERYSVFIEPLQFP